MKDERGKKFLEMVHSLDKSHCKAEERKKRIMRENLETWNRENRAFIEKCNREVDYLVDHGGHPTADESSTVGFFGSDCGDGSSI